MLKKSLLIFALSGFLIAPIDAVVVYFFPAFIPSSESQESFAFADLAASELGSFTAYREAVRSSHVFGALPIAGLPAAASARASDLRLKGIIELAGRDAIMENLKSKRTVFVKEGDRIEGYSVRKVGEDFIDLSDGSNEIRLKIEGST